MVNGLYGVSANASIDHYRLKGITGPTDEGHRCAALIGSGCAQLRREIEATGPQQRGKSANACGFGT